MLRPLPDHEDQNCGASEYGPFNRGAPREMKRLHPTERKNTSLPHARPVSACWVKPSRFHTSRTPGSFDPDTDVPAASSLFDAQVSNPTPVQLLGKTIPLPEVEDEAFPIGAIRSYANTTETSSSSALGLIIPAPPGQEHKFPNLRGCTRDRQLAPQSSFASCPLPTEILQICDSLPHRFGYSWSDLELGHRWSNQTTLSLICPLLVHQARRLLLHGKSTLADVTFGQLYEDPAQPRPILRGPSVMKLEHLESISVTSSANLAFLFDKRAVELPKLKRLSLTSRRGSCSGLSGPVVLDQALDIPWASLESLYLANESSSSCDILSILSNCSRLRQFSWSGDLEQFALSGRLPALKLSHLEELSISSSSEGCSALVNSFSKEILCNITKGSFTSLPSAFSRSNYLVNPKLTHLAVHDPIPLDKLVVILHVLAKLEYGKFALDVALKSWVQHLKEGKRLPSPDSLEVFAPWTVQSCIQNVTDIGALPVEILILIFDIYIDRDIPLEDEFHGYYMGSLVTHSSPLVLMQVCSHWRSITLGTPSLWTFICPSSNPIVYIRRWLAICPKYPLDLQLSRRPIDLVPRDYVQSVFKLFAKEAYRWRSLSIELDPEVTSELVEVFRSNNGAIPSQLEDLKVEPSLEDHFKVPGPTLETFVALLPGLKSLRRLIWVDPQGEVSLLNVPWMQLKTAIIKLPSSVQQIFSYLSQCTSATEVEFHSNTHADPQKNRLPSHRYPTFTLLNLTSLTLSRGCDPMWLLRHFTMPSLQHLEIGILHRDQQVLEDFLKRSPSIHTLVIDERHGEDDAYADEILISDHEILTYLTSPCLRAIPRVGIDLLYTKERIPALIQQRLDVHRPLPPLLCWRPSWYQRLVGWWDKLDSKYDALLFSYEEGAIELSPEYEFDDSDLP
ncbi:hypothetical protein NLJ89_g5 [Agrocybe chaxingu]|uniref:F-box domain-containing protein n=1 Tax=Agrocybe chaxingu TaxID=84603 RepID=A0A9W8TGF9_9AGAR|nr:hypothetical protein NLJ89_g5 [Agrocybe chaxingu]